MRSLKDKQFTFILLEYFRKKLDDRKTTNNGLQSTRNVGIGLVIHMKHINFNAALSGREGDVNPPPVTGSFR